MERKQEIGGNHTRIRLVKRERFLRDYMGAGNSAYRAMMETVPAAVFVPSKFGMGYLTDSTESDKSSTQMTICLLFSA